MHLNQDPIARVLEVSDGNISARIFDSSVVKAIATTPLYNWC